jgi:hypothetical protein
MQFFLGASDAHSQVGRAIRFIQRDFTFPITAAGSNGRRNTIQYIDSTTVAQENYLFGCTRSKPSQTGIPARLTLTSGFGFCFQCQAGFSLVLRRPIEITAFIRQWPITRL